MKNQKNFLYILTPTLLLFIPMLLLAKENITPLISDVLGSTPSFGFMAEQYPSLFERVKNDAVMCLGLLHHLHITGRQIFGRIAYLLAKSTKKYLIFEFVALEDENNFLLQSNRVINYINTTCIDALSRYFKDFIFIESDRVTRGLIVCELKS